MAMIEFVRNYQDLSTDRGYQFKFFCNRCNSGYESSFDPSLIGTASGLMQAAGSLFGGLLGSAGSTAYEIQRAVGGPAHDRAMQTAVNEVKDHFRKCQRCGSWVCAEVCWNAPVNQCTACTPKYEQEVIAARTEAQVFATRQQLYEKAQGTDYVSGIDMHPGTPPPLPFLNPTPALAAPAPSSAKCAACGAALTGGKFCAECGVPVPQSAPGLCSACGHQSAASAKFCEGCGHKLSA